MYEAGLPSHCSVTTWRVRVGKDMEGVAGSGQHKYTYGQFILMHDKNNHSIVIIPQLK